METPAGASAVARLSCARQVPAMRVFLPALALLASAPVLFARIDLLLVPPAKPVARDAELRFTLHLNNPTAFDDDILLPRVIEAVCAAVGARQEVILEAVGELRGRIRVPAATRRDVTLRLKTPLAAPGPFVSLRLVAPESNAIMFELLPPAVPPDPAAAPPVARAAPDLDLGGDIDTVRRHIAAYEPIYLVAGSRGRLNARFQFSFKYRFLEERPDEDLAKRHNPGPLLRRAARDLHFAYTQTSLWDLESSSKPFYDTSYKPALFLEHRLRALPAGWDRSRLHYGVQHESNGKSGRTGPDASRSLNTLYLAPAIRWAAPDGRFVEVRPRAVAYFHTEDNPAIARYRGHVELTLRGGLDRGWQVALHARGHPRGHGSVEFNFTLPVADLPWPAAQLRPLPDPRAALGGYFQVQYFNGYGESLLDYNVRRRDQLRFGFTLVR
jgi:outer membrane phospholipase A